MSQAGRKHLSLSESSGGLSRTGSGAATDSIENRGTDAGESSSVQPVPPAVLSDGHPSPGPGERERSTPIPVDASMQESEQLLWQAIRKSALRTALRLSEASSPGRSSDELLTAIMPFAESAWSLSRGQQSTLAPPASALPVSVLLDTLRRELTEELATLGNRTSLADALAVIRAVDDVKERVDTDPTHRFVSRFLGTAGIEALVEVAHDMRSPLASILLLVDTMRTGQSGPVNQVQERQLALVYGAAFGLSLLANDAIEMAKGGARILDPKPISFSVWDVFQSVREIVQPIAAEKDLGLQVNPPESDWRYGHPTALHRVLLNLTTNALKYTDTGKVVLSARQIDRTALDFSVTDTGRGIPEGVTATLFDAFRQTEGHGPVRFSSAGLGLSICRNLVQAMGGELRVANAEGGGTKFHFVLDLPLASKL